MDTCTALPPVQTQPDFMNLLKVLRREAPSRPTLFEFFLNGPLHEVLARGKKPASRRGIDLTVMEAFKNAGYDYVTYQVPGFVFKRGEVHSKSSISLNEGFVITDRASFEKYPWPNPDECDYAAIAELTEYLPKGMKVIVHGPGGVEENVIRLVGYENLCYMMADEPELVHDLFEAVGSRLERYYRKAAPLASVGACISNDDWGFKTQTLLSLGQMREYLFPWHKRIVEAIHAGGKPAILHSCGYYEQVIDAIVDELKYDARHSYEDAILPVEESYERFHDRIAILGGIDVDYVCRMAPEAVYERSKAMLERSASRGGYALGTGNSVPHWIPHDHYFAMIRAVTDARR